MNDLSIIRLVSEATLVVQLVMLGLLCASVYSWTIIFGKRRVLGAAKDSLARFEQKFWGGGDLNTLHRDIEAAGAARGIEAIFRMGFGEFLRLHRQGVDAPEVLLEGARRAMRAQQIKEVEHLEHSLSQLATVGSTSPYVGLFGTVWGIMNSFTAIAGMQSTNLAVVAPGIAEALFATAIGLVAAIPAVLAYNKISNDLTRFAARLEGFGTEFSAILSRQSEAKA